MFQKLQKKLKEFFGEKGQGAVEYALLLGFVATIIAYFTYSNGLTASTKQAMTNMNAQATAVTAAYKADPTASP